MGAGPLGLMGQSGCRRAVGTRALQGPPSPQSCWANLPVVLGQPGGAGASRLKITLVGLEPVLLWLLLKT